MGNPHIFYTRALQAFAHCLAAEGNDFLLAKKLYAEENEEVLEDFILRKKDEMDEKLYFYDAGRTCQVIMQEAYEEGCDSINASCGGLHEFEDFIGLTCDEDYTERSLLLRILSRFVDIRKSALTRSGLSDTVIEKCRMYMCSRMHISSMSYLTISKRR